MKEGSITKGKRGVEKGYVISRQRSEQSGRLVTRRQIVLMTCMTV